jgi:hypothetical protein
MTDEEADALDEYYTKNTVMPDSEEPGFFARRKAAHMVSIDEVSAHYILSKALAAHKTPSEIIGEMVQERIAASL